MNRGYLLVLAAVFFWGLNFVIARVMATSIQPAALASLRWLIAFLLFAPLFPTIWRMRSSILRNAKYYTMAAVSGLATYHVCLYSAGQTVDVYTMPLLNSCSGLFVIAILALTFKPLTKLQLLGALLALAGLLILLSRGEMTTLYAFRVRSGELWMLAGAAIWGFYSLVVERRPPGPKLACHATTILFALPFLGVMYGAESVYADPISWSWKLVGILLYLAAFPSVVCYWLWIAAIERLGAARTQAVYFTLPLVTAAQAWFLLGDELYSYHAFSALFIISGAILVAAFAAKIPQPKPANA